MVGAALLAKKAVDKGLSRKPWVKTTLAPGSKVVVDYYERAGLTPYLDKLGFNLVGYGCTTCIGNSGPLQPEISAAVNDGDLAVVSVLSGNRNFEGRINPDVKMNYLASPPLVVAYALAGTMDIDITKDPLGVGADGKDVYLSDLWPSEKEIADVIGDAIQSDMFARDYSDVFAGDERWQGLPLGDSGPEAFSWDDASTYVRKPPYFEGMEREPAPVADIEGARVLAMLGDSVTTDHISPAGSIKRDSPAGKYLSDNGVDAKDFNSYGSRRGNHEVMIRGTFANIRLRNQLAPGTEGGVTRHLPDGAQASIYDAAQQYAAEGVPLVVLAGKEYGSGSSRDWAAKGTALLGVRAVIAESYERIHRSNLIGMGVLPLQYPQGQTGESLGLTGEEEFTIRGLAERVARDGDDLGAGRRQDLRRRRAYRHSRRGRVLPARRDPALRAALAARAVTDPGALLEIALQIAREAGTLLAGGRSHVSVAATKSSPTDVVTAMDKASEELIGSRLAELRPGDGLLAEEGSSRPSTTGLSWIVDPLDGTVNYLYGIPFWSVSIAVCPAQAPIEEALVGVVHAPMLAMTWVGQRGEGSSRDGVPLSGSAATALEEALVATGFGYEATRRARQAEVVGRVLPRVRDVRRLGSAAVDLCLTAEGILDAYFEQGLKPWDRAAGSLIAREAGLTVAGLDGTPPGEALTIAAPAALFGPLSSVLAEEPRADSA